MRRSLIAFFLLCGTLAASAQSPLTTMGAGPGHVAPAGCSQATSFLARTSGLNAAHQTAYTTMICGLVTDGVFAKQDALYVLATADQTTALLNLISTSFTATKTGSPTFTIDQGYHGDGSNYIDTNLNSSTAGGIMTDSSRHFAVWDNAAGVGDGGSQIGNGGGEQVIYARFTNGNTFYRNLGDIIVANAAAAGFYACNLSSATAAQAYQNGTSVGSGSFTGAALINSNWVVIANGTGAFSSDQILAASFGGSLNSTEQAALYARLHTYLQTIAGIP